LAKSDNNALLAGLVAGHGEQLRRFLLPRVRVKEDASDLIQEVYLRMLRVPHWEAIRSPEAYVFTVARHVLQQHQLREGSIPHSNDFTQLFDAPEAPPDDDPVLAASAQQCVERLQRSLNRLPFQTRAAFMLHRRDGHKELLICSCPRGRRS